MLTRGGDVRVHGWGSRLKGVWTGAPSVVGGENEGPVGVGELSGIEASCSAGELLVSGKTIHMYDVLGKWSSWGRSQLCHLSRE